MRIQLTNFTIKHKPDPSNGGEDAEIMSVVQTRPSAYKELITDDVEALAKKIAEGRAFHACNVSGSFRKPDCVDSWIVCADFDHIDETPEEIADSLTAEGIAPNFYYWSYSQNIKPKNNFRIVWCFDRAISPKSVEKICGALMWWSRGHGYEQDESCKNCNRLWWGTVNGYSILNRELVAPSIFDALVVAAENAEGTRSDRIYDVKSNKVIAESDESYTPVAKVEVAWEGTWRQELYDKCPLWRDWVDGEYMSYNNRLKLLTNMKYLKITDTGHTITELVLEHYNNNIEMWNTESATCTEAQIRTLLKQTGLRPFRICNHNTLTVPDLLRGAQPNTMYKTTALELEFEMEEKLPAAFDSPDNEMVSSPTGSGKTKIVRDYMQAHPADKMLYVAPFHALLHEVADKLKAENGLTMIVPPATEYTPDEIRIMAAGGSVQMNNPDRKRIFEEIKDSRYGGIYGITHMALINLGNLRNSGIKMVYVDENIEDALTNEIEFDLAAFMHLKPYATKWDKSIVDYFTLPELTAVDAEPFAAIVASTNINYYALSGCPTISGIGRLAKGTWHGYATNMGTIRFTQVKDTFDCGVPIKYLTATPQKNYMRIITGFKMHEVDVNMSENKGKIIQYLGITGAKGTGGAKVKDLIKFAAKNIDEDPTETYVISFKESVEEWVAAGYKILEYDDGKYMHLSHNAGVDALKGKTVIVAGKFDKPQRWYENFFYDWIYKAGMAKPQLKMQTIKVGDIYTKLFLWDNDDLRAVQCELIEKYLEQAAGRARALRDAGAKVYVLANYPITSADVYIR